MNKREFEEHRKWIAHKRVIRKQVISDFFVDFIRYFRPWLHDLTRQYKERGQYPVMACWLLPSYYQKSNDKEIAAFASMLIRDDAKVMERVNAFRHLMGDSPYDWFASRGFVYLSTGTMCKKKTGGVMNERIAKYFDTLYGCWGNRQSALRIIMLSAFGEETYIDKANMLRLVLEPSDGLGLGLWSMMSRKIRCPLTRDVMSMLRTFLPDCGIFHDDDAAIRLFGFENDYDFFYAALAYKELQKRNPKGCSRLATVYQKRYAERSMQENRYWAGSRGILPEINFD